MANEVAVTTQTRSVLVDMATRYGMEAAAFEETVRATAMRPDSRGNVPSKAEFAAFLLVAKEYKLNPLLKEIYAFPAQRGGIVPVVSIDGWVNLVNSNPQLDGFDFTFEHDEKGALLSCTCTMYRKDRTRPVIVTEFLSECIRSTDPWKMQHRMLRHKALIQAARYCFGFSGIYDQDEAEKISEMRDVTPIKSAPPAPPSEDTGKGDDKIQDAEFETVDPGKTAKDPEAEKKAAERAEREAAKKRRDQQAEESAKAAAREVEERARAEEEARRVKEAEDADDSLPDDGGDANEFDPVEAMREIAKSSISFDLYLGEADKILEQVHDRDTLKVVWDERRAVANKDEKQRHLAMVTVHSERIRDAVTAPKQTTSSAPAAGGGEKSEDARITDALAELQGLVEAKDGDAIMSLAEAVQEQVEQGLISRRAFDERMESAFSDAISRYA